MYLLTVSNTSTWVLLTRYKFNVDFVPRNPNMNMPTLVLVVIIINSYNLIPNTEYNDIVHSATISTCAIPVILNTALHDKIMR